MKHPGIEFLISEHKRQSPITIPLFAILLGIFTVPAGIASLFTNYFFIHGCLIIIGGVFYIIMGIISLSKTILHNEFPQNYSTANIYDRRFIDFIKPFLMFIKSSKIRNILQSIFMALILAFCVVCFLSLPFWAMIMFVFFIVLL